MSAPSLEKRITAALSAKDIASAVLVTLIAETEAAIAEANATADAERRKALDPLVSPDPAKARQSMEHAAFERDRQRTVLPRLQRRLNKVSDQEDYDRWVLDFEAVKAMRDGAAEDLSRLFVPFVSQFVSLLHRIEATDGEVRRVTAAKPVYADAANGDGRSLLPVELHARGIADFGRSESITKDLHLPAWETGALPLWPPRRTTAADLAVLTAQIGQQARDPRLSTAAWWKVKEDAERQRTEEAARLKREEAERRAAMPVPAHSDWGERWERETAARAARARP
jgi:hypothetical protein